MPTPRPKKKKSWRCFHCDEVFQSRKSAWAHFGPDQDCEKLPPACIDPLRSDEKSRLTELREAQQYAFNCQESANSASDKIDEVESTLDQFRKLTQCSGVHELRMKMDSEQGELLTARALIEAVRVKAPSIYTEIIG